MADLESLHAGGQAGDYGAEQWRIVDGRGNDAAAGPVRVRAAGGIGDSSNVLANIARDHDATPMQIALAWLLQRSPVMLPIPGTSNRNHLRANVSAASIKLSNDEMNRLNSLAG